MIKKEKHALKSALALSALGGIPAAVTTASADTGQVVYTHESGAGKSTITDNTGVANNSEINAVNSLIRNLQTKSNGIVTISDKIVEVKDNQIPDLKNKLSTLSDLIGQYNTLKAELDTQNNSNEALNGMRGVDITQNVTGSDLNGTISNLQNLIKTMQDDVNYNKTVVGQNAFDTSQDRALNQKVKEANQTITGAANSIKHYKDGIFGDLDMVKRKSQDSIAQGGIVVDNTETQKINTIKTDQKISDQKTEVKTIDEANQNLDRILNNIKTQNQSNHVQAANAAHYRSNALYNIDDLNVWLGNMRQKAQDAKTEASKHKTSLDHLNSYKADEQRRMQEVIDDYKTTGAVDNDSLDSMNKALDAIKQSTITHENVTVGQKDPIDFADIGADPDAQNGSQDGSISNTKKTEMDRFTNDITNAINQAIKNDADANKQIDNAKAINDKTIETIKKVAAQARQYKAAQDLYNQREADYDNSMSTFDSALSTYNKALTDFASIKAQHDQDVASFNAAKTEFENETNQFDAEADRFNRAAAAFETAKTAYENLPAGTTQNVASKAKFDEAVNNYNAAKAEFDRTNATYAQRKADFQKKLDAFNQSQADFDNAKKAFDQSTKSYQDAKAKHDSDLAKYDQLKRKTYQNDDEYNTAYAQYEQDSNNFIQELNKFKANSANYNGQMQDYIAKQRQYDNDRATYQQQLADFNKARDNYRKAQEAYEASIDKYYKDLATYNSEVGSYPERWNDYVHDHSTYEQALAKYNNEDVPNYQKALATYNTEVANYQTYLTGLIKDCQDYVQKHKITLDESDKPSSNNEDIAKWYVQKLNDWYEKNKNGTSGSSGSGTYDKAYIKDQIAKLIGAGQDRDAIDKYADKMDLAYQEQLAGKLEKLNTFSDDVYTIRPGASQYDVIAAVRQAHNKQNGNNGDMRNGTQYTAGYFWTNPSLQHAIWMRNDKDGHFYAGTAQGVINYLANYTGSDIWTHGDNPRNQDFKLDPWVKDYLNQYKSSDYVTLGEIGENDMAAVIIPNAFRYVDKNGNAHWIPVKISMRLMAADGETTLYDWYKRNPLPMSSSYKLLTMFSVSAGHNRLHIGAGWLLGQYLNEGSGAGGWIDSGGHGEGLLLDDPSVQQSTGRGGQSALTDLSGDSGLIHGRHMKPSDFSDANEGSANGVYYQLVTPAQINRGTALVDMPMTMMNGAGTNLKVWIEPVRAYTDMSDSNNWKLTSNVSDEDWKNICDAINYMPVDVGDIDDHQDLRIEAGNGYYKAKDGAGNGFTVSSYKGIGHIFTNDYGSNISLIDDNKNIIGDNDVLIDQHSTTKHFESARQSPGSRYMSTDLSFGGTGPAVVVPPSGPEKPPTGEFVPHVPPVPPTPPTDPPAPTKPVPPVPPVPKVPETPPTPPTIVTPPTISVPPVPPVPPKPPKHTFDVAGVNGKVTDLTVNDQNAKAKTVGEYNIQSAIEYLYTGSNPPGTPKNVSANFILDQIKAILPSIKKTASNTSLVVRKQGDRQVKTASGNSLTVRVKNRQVKTASGNSLTVRVKNNTVKTASGNSLTVRVRHNTVKTASGNSLVVRVRHDMSSAEPNIGSVTTPIGVVDNGSAQKAYDTQNNSLLLNGAVPVVQQKWNGQSVVLMSVYADPNLLENTKQAIREWNDALKAYGVQIDATFTDNVDDLRNGVTIAVMDSDNNNEIISSWQRPEQDDITMSQKAGLTTAIVRDVLHGNGLNDKYNTAGTITAGDTLKNSVFTVQINREGIASIGDPNTLIQKTLTHELGHVFGLSHDMNDSLMTTAIRNPSFTGVISKRDAELAARQLVNDPTHPTDLFLN